MSKSSFFRITDSKGFAVRFPNGWAVSVQFGYGNYSDNYDARGEAMEESYAARNKRCGEQGSSTAECAVFDPTGEMVKLPAFMFADEDYADIVSNRSRSPEVLQLLNWAASQQAPEAV